MIFTLHTDVRTFLLTINICLGPSLAVFLHFNVIFVKVPSKNLCGSLCVTESVQQSNRPSWRKVVVVCRNSFTLLEQWVFNAMKMINVHIPVSMNLMQSIPQFVIRNLVE